MGLNSTEQEEKDNILRAEIVVQRDGLPSGRALFKCDVERQRCTEFTKEQRKQYDEVYGSKLDEQFKKKDNPDADSKKGKELLEISKCKLGYHEWVAVHSYEYRQRPRRAIFSHKGGRKKAQYYTKRKPNIIVITVGGRKGENKESRDSKDRWSDGYALEISHNGWQTTSIGNLDLEDLKR